MHIFKFYVMIKKAKAVNRFSKIFIKLYLNCITAYNCSDVKLKYKLCVYENCQIPQCGVAKHILPNDFVLTL